LCTDRGDKEGVPPGGTGEGVRQNNERSTGQGSLAIGQRDSRTNARGYRDAEQRNNRFMNEINGRTTINKSLKGTGVGIQANRQIKQMRNRRGI
jgi:hypothetical protein